MHLISIFPSMVWNSIAIGTLKCRPFKIHYTFRYDQGLATVNNAEVTDVEILQANRVFGSLGELAVMVLPQVSSNFMEIGS